MQSFRPKNIFYLLILLIGFLPNTLFATHLVGADLKYRCLGGNRFELTFTLYQDCLGGTAIAISADNPLKFGIYTGDDFQNFYFADSLYINSTTFIPAEFSNDCISNAPNTCLQAATFTTIVTLAPSPYGYRMIYQRCCRNNFLANIRNSGETGITFYLDIPPFANGQCPNNSATFVSLPPQIICMNNLFRYSFAARDVDGDSLSYRLCTAYTGGSMSLPIPRGDQMRSFGPVTYNPPYSASNPIASVPPLTIDPVTGIMEAFPTLASRFGVTVCVDEWRNGVVINTVTRDVQFTVTNCSKNVVANIPSWPDNPSIYKIQCESFTVDFENTSTGGMTYLWRFGENGATSTSFEPSYTYSDTGRYMVTLIVNPGTTCSDSITKEVRVYPFFTTQIEYTGKTCPGEPINFKGIVNSPGSSPVSFHWDLNGEGVANTQNTTFSFAQGGTKNIFFTSVGDLGCLDTSRVSVYVDSFKAFAGNDTIIVKDYPFSLNGKGLDNYLWTPANYLSDRNIANPTADFPDTGTYTYVLSGTSPSGCFGSDTIVIRVVDKAHMFLPNAFTPNNDGINDLLKPNLVGFSIIRTFEIFDRWGQLMYKAANDNDFGWDGTHKGKPADVGVYYYRITYVDAITQEELAQTGDVTLLR